MFETDLVSSAEPLNRLSTNLKRNRIKSIPTLFQDVFPLHSELSHTFSVKVESVARLLDWGLEKFRLGRQLKLVKAATLAALKTLRILMLTFFHLLNNKKPQS